LFMISALFHCILWSSSHECSAILDLDIFSILVLHLCSVILLSSLPVSPIRGVTVKFPECPCKSCI
jgi:hypothetical protein